MAICCFLIENLECFYEGLPDTKEIKEGERVLKEFFRREKNNFQGLLDQSTDFYYSVRCSILHQGETMNGWFLQKRSKLYDYTNGIKKINGELVFQTTNKAIENYLAHIDDRQFEYEYCKHPFAKLKQVCENFRKIKKYDEVLL